VSAIIKNKN